MERSVLEAAMLAAALHRLETILLEDLARDPVDRWLEFGRADMLQMLEAAFGRGQVPEWLDIPELLSWHQPDLLELLPSALPALAGGAAAATRQLVDSDYGRNLSTMSGTGATQHFPSGLKHFS
jgi:hypothetical protein